MSIQVFVDKYTAPLEIERLLSMAPDVQRALVECRLLAAVLAVDPQRHQVVVDASTATLWATEALAIEALHLDMSAAQAANDSAACWKTVQECLDDAYECEGRLWRGTRWLSLAAIQSTPQLLVRSDTPIARAIFEVNSAILSAFHRHGHYDPTTNHQPPPGYELDAIEHRERGRDLMNDLLPGMGDLMAGTLPTERPPRGEVAT